MQANMHVDVFVDLVKHAQATLERTPVNDPDRPIGKLLEKMPLARTNAREAGHLCDGALVQLDRQFVG